MRAGGVIIPLTLSSHYQQHDFVLARSKISVVKMKTLAPFVLESCDLRQEQFSTHHNQVVTRV